MRVKRVVVMAGVLVALGAPSFASGHHPGQTAAEHSQEDAVVHDAATEARLGKRTRDATAAASAAAAAAVTGTEHQIGQWGPVVDWPVVGIHNALMPDGKVVAWDTVGDRATVTSEVHDHTRATVWDPATGAHTDARVNTGFNIFCAGFAHLVDGRLYVAGGNKNKLLQGIAQTHVFDSSSGWRRDPDMGFERWYPSVTPLQNGEMLVTEGGPDTPEVRTTSGALRRLTSASLNLPLYPWLDVAPNGRVLYSGPDQTMRSLDPAGTGSWQTHGQRDPIDRGYGSRALYDVGKLLVSGGGASTKDSRVIDFNGATPQATVTNPMANGRRQHNLTVLADGSVLATGGNSSGAGLVDLNAGVYAAERWNPATGQWTTLAAQAVTRQYHSTALLLPDGRVLSSGGGICGTCDQVGYLAKNAEVFTPPYLFKTDGSGQFAPRPVIDTAPSAVPYNASFSLGTADAASIRKVALARLGSVTHSVDMEQRYVPLSFTAGSGTLTVTAPSNANIAPPGVYMLIVTDAAGVPSVAKMISVGTAANTPPSVTLTQPANGATFTAPATVTLAATASDSGGTVSKVEFFNGTTKLSEDTTAPYAYSWQGVAAGSYTITARAMDDVGATATSAPATITVAGSTANATPTASITSPANGASFGWKPTIDINATASDPDGTVQKVEFYRSYGATKLGEDTTAPYTYRWRNAPSGTQVLRVKATDNRGAAGPLCAPVTITIRPKGRIVMEL